MTQQVSDVVQQLGHSRSPKRRSAAKALRKLRRLEAGPPLLDALIREIKDPRTWETQYQMIMALGESGYRDALPTLEELSRRDSNASMVDVAIGDALVRLSVKHDKDAGPVLALIRRGRRGLTDGAFRAMALLRMVPDEAAINEILDFVEPLPRDDLLRFWVAAAAPGWSGPRVEAFVNDCENSHRDVLREAGAYARARNYKDWRPL